jgi:hypothetical protein
MAKKAMEDGKDEDDELGFFSFGWFGGSRGGEDEGSERFVRAGRGGIKSAKGRCSLGRKCPQGPGFGPKDFLRLPRITNSFNVAIP